jgi:hypothetical protein
MGTNYIRSALADMLGFDWTERLPDVGKDSKEGRDKDKGDKNSDKKGKDAAEKTEKDLVEKIEKEAEANDATNDEDKNATEKDAAKKDTDEENLLIGTKTQRTVRQLIRLGRHWVQSLLPHCMSKRNRVDYGLIQESDIEVSYDPQAAARTI